MTPKARLDAELVSRGLARSRSEAKQLIADGEVLVRGLPAESPTSLVDQQDAIALAPEASRFVSRGGLKLDGALQKLEVEVAGRRWLDLGASTGGFTDRLLQGGAAAVTAIDVGYGQLDWKLRSDPRVQVIDRMNARHLTRDVLPFVPDGVTADLSFISLTVVLPAVVSAVGTGADYVLMVKPQFEVGKDSVGKGGVVRDPQLWRSSIERVVEGSTGLGLILRGAAASPLPGPSGNREFFLHLSGSGIADRDAVERAISEAL